MSPATSAKQQRYMGMQLGKKRAGQPTDVDMSEKDLRDFARKRKPHRGSGPLTPLGQRTLAGFQKKWGDAEGRAKFEKALDDGVLDPDRMLASSKGDDGKKAVSAPEKESDPRRSAEGNFQSRQD